MDINFESLGVSKVTDKHSMFNDCSSLKEVKLPKDANTGERIIKQLKFDNIHCKVI